MTATKEPYNYPGVGSNLLLLVIGCQWCNLHRAEERLRALGTALRIPWVKLLELASHYVLVYLSMVANWVWARGRVWWQGGCGLEDEYGGKVGVGSRTSNPIRPLHLRMPHRVHPPATIDASMRCCQRLNSMVESQ